MTGKEGQCIEKGNKMSTFLERCLNNIIIMDPAGYIRELPRLRRTVHRHTGRCIVKKNMAPKLDMAIQHQIGHVQGWHDIKRAEDNLCFQ